MGEKTKKPKFSEEFGEMEVISLDELLDGEIDAFAAMENPPKPC